MRKIYEVAFPVLCLACTPTEPESKAAPAEAKAVPAVEPVEAAPPGKTEPPPTIDSSVPNFVIVPHEPEGEMDWECHYNIESHGFPAISEDGKTIVGTQTQDERDSDPYTELTWYEANEDRITVVCDEALPHSDNPDVPPPDCADHLDDARKRVAKLNEELAAKKWRRLEPLNALFSDPGPALASEWFNIDPFSDLDIDPVLDSLPASDRPLEIYYGNGNFIARIKGVKVLQDMPRPDWKKPEPAPVAVADEGQCSIAPPQIFAVQFDPVTSLALVYYNHNLASCICDDYAVYTKRIQLNPDVIVEAEKRSNEKFMAALQGVVEKEERGEEEEDVDY